MAMAFLQIWALGQGAPARARSRRGERIGGEKVFDRVELPDALGRPGRAFVADLILVRVASLGVFLVLFAFESLKMGANFIGRKEAPHFEDKSRKLPREGRMITSDAGEIHQFLTDHIVERRLEPKALSDGPRRFALLDPNLMVFAHSRRNHSTYCTSLIPSSVHRCAWCGFLPLTMRR